MSFRYKHWRHVVIIGLFVFTGLALFLTRWRTALGPFFPVVQDIHEYGGILYGVALVGWSARFFPLAPGSRAPAYTRWGMFFLVVLAVTGVGLLVGPSLTRSIATVGHGAAAAAFIVWAAWHLISRVPLYRRRIPPDGVPGLRLNRRRFVRYALSVVAAVPAVGALPTVLKMVGGRILPDVKAASDAGALPGFVPYTVVDGYPRLDRATWRLTLEGLGPDKTWTWDQWAREPVRSTIIDFRCVTGWVVPGVAVEGVDLHDWLVGQGWTGGPSQRWVIFYSGDGVYTETMDADQIRQYRPIMAWSLDHKPLAVAQGFPLRLIVPNMYGYKSIKWLIRIRVGPKAPLGYWEERGYPEDAYYGSYVGI